jgi:phage baseplate assembly protein V
MLNAINKALAPTRRAVANMIGRAVLQAIKDTPKMQELQISLLTDEVRQRAERFQNFGFTSVPHAGAEAIALFPGGDRSAPIVIVVDDRRYRLKGLADGEVAMYNEHGDKVHFKQNRDIDVTTAANVNVQAVDVNVTCENATIDASADVSVHADGNATVDADGDATVHADDDVNVTCGDIATITATTQITMTAPTIQMNASTKVDVVSPLLDASTLIAAHGALSFSAAGDIYTSAGDITTANGDIVATAGSVTAFDTVTADTVVGTTHVTAAGHSLEQHKHGGVTVGAGQTGFNI